ncbi:MAG TPA: carboxypeptidase-like regulatory domain-containing protein, partial [Bryobacteraceae bacterium]
MCGTRNFVVSALLTVACATGLFAQSNVNQQISGSVADATGAVLPNASVTIADQGTGLTRNVKTNAAGNYVVPNLPTGRYRVSCEAPGFKKQIVDDNDLLTDVSIEVNCKLQVGSQSDSVTIQADAVTVETSNGDYGATVTGEQAGELQLNGRNFPELLQLLPGVSTTYTDGFGLFGGYGVNNSGQSINGGRTDTTTWNLDGGDNKDNGGGGNNFVNINPNAIGEFRVKTSNYSAEAGTSSGAVVDIAIRSGTKAFHGMLYEYWRNDHLQAFGFQSLAKPKLRWNNFGGNIGGPVTIPGFNRFNHDHDKLFFFFSEDLKYLRLGASTTWTVPTAAVKSGNFGTTRVNDPENGGVQFPNNVIPQSRIDPNMQKLVNIYPAANSGTASFIFNETTPTNVHQEVVRTDYNLNEKNQLSFHWAHDHYNQLENTTNLIQYYRQIPGQNTSL